jgi:predicted HicB family RNase H-like nuclease
MKYKGFIGHANYDDEAEIFFGEVINTSDVITFQSDNSKILKEEFKASVDEYLSFCMEKGVSPEKPFSGKFLVRMKPETHRQISLIARISGISVNKWLNDTVQQRLESSDIPSL